MNKVIAAQGAATAYQATLQDFKNAFHLKGTQFKTSVDSTKGALYVKDGQLCSANRHGGTGKVKSSVTNLALRNALIDAFEDAGATEKFVQKLRKELLQESGNADLDRKTVKGFIVAFENQEGNRLNDAALEGRPELHQKAIRNAASLDVDDFRELAKANGFVGGLPDWTNAKAGIAAEKGWLTCELKVSRDDYSLLRSRFFDVVKDEVEKSEKSDDLTACQKSDRKLLVQNLRLTLIGSDRDKPLTCDEIRRTLRALDRNMSYVPSKALNDRTIKVSGANQGLANLPDQQENEAERIDVEAEVARYPKINLPPAGRLAADEVHLSSLHGELPGNVAIKFSESQIAVYGKFAEKLSASHGLADALQQCDQSVLNEELFSPESGYTMTVREAFTLIANGPLAEEGKEDWSGVIQSRLEERPNAPTDFRYPVILSLAAKDEGFRMAVEERMDVVFGDKMKEYDENHPDVPKMKGANPMTRRDKAYFRELFCEKETYGSTLNLNEFMLKLIGMCRGSLPHIDNLGDCYKDAEARVILMSPSFSDLPDVAGKIPVEPLKIPESIRVAAADLEARMSKLEPTLNLLRDELSERYGDLLSDDAPRNECKDAYARYYVCRRLFGSNEKSKNNVGLFIDNVAFFKEKFDVIRDGLRRIHACRDELTKCTDRAHYDARVKQITDFSESLKERMDAIETACNEFSKINKGEPECTLEECLDKIGLKNLSDNFRNSKYACDSKDLREHERDIERDYGRLISSLGDPWTKVRDASDLIDRDAKWLCVSRGMREFFDSQEWQSVDCLTQGEKDSISRSVIDKLLLDKLESYYPSVDDIIRKCDCWNFMPLGRKKRQVFECLYAQFVTRHFDGGYFGLQIPERLKLDTSWRSDMTEDQKDYNRKLYGYFGHPLADDASLEDLTCAWGLGWTYAAVASCKKEGLEYDLSLEQPLSRTQLKERIDKNFSFYHVMDAEDAKDTKVAKDALSAKVQENHAQVDAGQSYVWDAAETEPKLSDLRRLAVELMSRPESRHAVLKDQSVRSVFDSHEEWIRKAVHWLAMKKLEVKKPTLLNPMVLARTLGEDNKVCNSVDILKAFGLAEDAANVVAVFLNKIVYNVFDRRAMDHLFINTSLTMEEIGKQMWTNEQKGYEPLMGQFDKLVTAPVEGCVKIVCKNIQDKVGDYFKEKFPALPAGATQATIRGEILTQAKDPKVPLDDVIGKKQVDLDAELVRRVLNSYFGEIPPLDRHLLLATKIENCNAGPNDGDGTKQRKNISALLKSSGPVLIKMLQGLDASSFKDETMRGILKELKGELYPIPASQRDVLIRAAIDRWNATNDRKIERIECGQSLGAASVGETIACKVYYAGEDNPVDCAMKLLRPEARLRAARERDIFLKIAEEMDRELGTDMQATYKGKLDAIMRELDLTDEATFVTIGKTAYEEKTDDLKCCQHDKVSSESLTEGASPSRNVMLLQKAEGTTVQNHFAELRRQFDEVKAGNRPEADFAELRKKAQDCHESLEQLAELWFARAVFCEKGFYHGDLHAGNVMIDGENKLTLIDYGNAKQLSVNEAKAFVHIVAGAAAGISELQNGVVYGFSQLVPAGRERDAFLDKLKAPEIDEAIRAILKKGNGRDCGKRLQAILQVFKACGVEIPGAIYNFIESQIRLANMLEESRQLVEDIARESGVREAEPRDLFTCVADVVAANKDQALVLLGKIIAPLFMVGFVQNDLMKKEDAFQTMKNVVADAVPDVLKGLFKTGDGASTL